MNHGTDPVHVLSHRRENLHGRVNLEGMMFQPGDCDRGGTAHIRESSALQESVRQSSREHKEAKKFKTQVLPGPKMALDVRLGRCPEKD